MNRIVVSFIVDGNSVSSSVVAPPSGGTKVYNFDLSGYGAPESVEVAPIFASGSREKVGAVTSKVGISSGTIGEVRGAVYEIGLDYVYEVPTDGLISFWTFSGDVLDGWGENDGIVFGEGDELVGGELVLDGNDYVNIGDPVDGSLDFGVQSFSVGVWMKGEIPVDDKSYILGNFYPGYAFHIRKDTNNIRFVTYTHSGATSYVQANINSVLDGEWHYLLGVRDVLSDTLRIYLDGSLLSSVADNSLNIDTARPFEMGRGNDAGGTYYFSGQIDNVMVFNKVLLEEEVIAIYGAQRKS